VHPQWPDLASRVAFAQIVGRRGLADDDSVHLGLTLMAPRTHYPLHAHPAIELYLVLAGAADWRVGGAPFVRQAPGAFVLHVSGIGHAMRTDAEPMLALYFWRGDLETSPVYVDEPAPP
jgi:anti-sigma factor ChrR (cupin superfamily)